MNSVTKSFSATRQHPRHGLRYRTSKSQLFSKFLAILWPSAWSEIIAHWLKQKKRKDTSYHWYLIIDIDLPTSLSSPYHYDLFVWCSLTFSKFRTLSSSFWPWDSSYYWDSDIDPAHPLISHWSMSNKVKIIATENARFLFSSSFSE